MSSKSIFEKKNFRLKAPALRPKQKFIYIIRNNLNRPTHSIDDMESFK